MEDITKRVNNLEEKQRQTEAADLTMLGIVKGIDAKATLTETRINVISAYQAAHDVRLNALTQDMQASFKQIEATMATKADVETLRAEVNELRVQVLMSFQHVLAVLDERLPAKAKE